MTPTESFIVSFVVAFVVAYCFVQWMNRDK